MKKACCDCLYSDNCPNKKRACSFYYPIDGEILEKELEDLIEDRRKEFYKQWEVYTDGWD